jgi:hypothetical protein
VSDATGTGTSSPAGWFPDPLGRYEHRYFNGVTWTADVSVDGQRYVDPLPLQSPSAVPPGTGTYGGYGAYQSPPGTGMPPGWSAYPGAKRPTRTMAVLAFIASLVSIATGWMPFVFVIGLAGGVTGLVLGIIARRKVSRGHALGGGLAVAAIVLSPIGLLLCIVGGIWSVNAYREFVDYLEPGPNDVEVTGCTVDGPSVQVTGTIENLDDEVHDYTITVDVLDGDRRMDTIDVEVNDVAPGEVRSWEDLALTRGDEVTEPSCDVRAVNGPFPFGLDPNA